MEESHKVPQKRVPLETKEMKRGKPHKQETQILVEESKRLESEQTFGTEQSVDRCLSLSLRKLQNMAYKVLFFYLR